jgi:hypothetical protein
LKHADIDELTLWDVQEQGEYWLEHPPVHILVAAFVGYHSKDTPSQAGQIPPDFWPATSDDGLDWRGQLAAMPGVAAGTLPEGISGTFDMSLLN